MYRVFIALFGGAVLTVNTLAADAVIEGTIGALPKSGAQPVATSRYESKTPETVAPAEAPAAVVYLEGEFPPATTNALVTAQLLQRQFQFAPALLPVRKGTSVEFPNLDDSYHNVFSYSRTKSFDLGRYRKEEKPAAVVFDQPGVVKLYCEIHPHMRGTILVLDTPHFIKTDTNGTFRLTGLPAGKFTLKVWLDEKKVLERPVELKEGVTLRADFPAE